MRKISGLDIGVTNLKTLKVNDAVKNDKNIKLIKRDKKDIVISIYDNSEMLLCREYNSVNEVCNTE